MTFYDRTFVNLLRPEYLRQRSKQALAAHHWRRLFIVVCAVIAGQACSSEPPPAQSGSGPYSYTERNRDGIGKFYMGREISWVMGHQGAGWLERPERQQEERTDLLLANLPMQPGDTLADIGAGSGYFTLPMAELTGPEGRVYAVDIQPEMLEIIDGKIRQVGIDNIVPVLATEKSPELPANSIDLALFVDVYHELEWPLEVMTSLVASLKPGGRVILIEYRAEDPSIPILRLHKMTESQARAEMAVLGLEFVENIDILPRQHFLVFAKPGGS